MRTIKHICPGCLTETRDHYMVTEQCWEDAGLGFYDNVHLTCLANLLGRPLTKEDFTDVPINDWLTTQELEKLMKDYTPRYSDSYIAEHLDYAVLDPLATIQDIKDGAAFCNKHRIKAYCVASVNVPIAAAMHDNVCAVIGFPHGNSSPVAKYEEGAIALASGAKELDVVINYGRFLGGDEAIIDRDLHRLCACENAVVKAILESYSYTPSQLVRACELCIRVGVNFVKTSTGFGHGPATPEDVQVMLDTVCGTGVQVKASGGIKTYRDAIKYLDMGCGRLGASRFRSLCYGS